MIRLPHPRIVAVLAASIFAGPGGIAAQSLLQDLPDAAVLGELRMRNIGPAVMSGRIADIDVAVPAGETPGRVIWTATAAGGVWVSRNGGITWESRFDDEPVASIGDVTVAPSNSDIVWVGTGESNNLRSSSWGNGVYRSIDGGETWTHMGLRESQHVPRILIHPTNPDIVYVAAMGPLWRSGGERGVYRSRNGGATWQRVLETGSTTGATDLVFDPSNPQIIYAATMQRERKSYSFVAGGPESAIYKSTNGGDTWTRLSAGLPEGDRGRIGLDVSRSDPRIVYAFVDAQDGGVFRSDDGGDAWARQSNLNTLPWFTGQVRVDPANPNRVYHLGQALSVSNNGGRDWERIANSTHADHHAMWINPSNPDHVIIGNDGGLYVSHDGAVTWDFALNLPVSTFYAIGIDMREPYYWVYGGLQDNGTWGAPVSSRNRTGITNDMWYRVGGGDGFHAAIDPDNPRIVYSESQNGALNRVDQETGESKSIRPSPEGLELRWNWSAPLIISRHDPATLYFGANYLFRSADRGDSWQTLGGDLTRSLDRDTLPIMGRNTAGGYRRHEGTAAFGNIATISESPVRAGILWVGTDDGLIQLSRDGGATWRRIDSFPGVPRLTYVSRVEASHHAEGTVYATFDNHRDNDFRPYILKSTDFGATWTSLASNLPDHGSLQVVREHPRNPELLFAGSEFGLFVSVNGGRSWATLRHAGFPTVAVHDIAVHPRDNDVIVGTHGRGIWVLDDITPLERLAASTVAAVAHVFAVRPATAFNLEDGPGSFGDRGYVGQNGPRGAVITYALTGSVGSGLSLAVLDTSGAVIRSFEADPSPGLHRVEWDLRREPPGDAATGGRGGGFGFGAAPWAKAGPYAAELRVTEAGQARALSRATFEIRRDALAPLSDAEWDQLEEWRERAYAVQLGANTLIVQLEATRDAASETDVARIEQILTALRGQAGGRGGRGGFGGRGGASSSVLGQVTGPAAQIGSNHFPVTAAQRADIVAAERALEMQREAARGLLTSR